MSQNISPTLDAALPTEAVELQYVLASIDAANSPIDSNHTGWYRYVIKLGSNEIVGHRRGDDEVVRREVELIVTQLNMRLHLKSKRAANGKR